MIANLDKLTEGGCSSDRADKVCRSRGGESCAFDGAMIVLQPIADTAHIVHGPIACCGNSWEGRGSLSTKGDLHRMGFTTDMSEMDIIYGSEKKLYKAILQTAESVKPKAVFVYATCVSGLIGEDIEAVCREAETELGIMVIPVNAPGFVGPKNLGNRIAGEVLLEHVIGTGQLPTEIIMPPSPGNHNAPHPPLIFPHSGGFAEEKRVGVLPPLEVRGGEEGLCEEKYGQLHINLIGEYNIAGDLYLVEPILKRAGFKILSRMTGDASFDEITWAHRADLNVVVCSRALINVATGMEQKYGIPYVEVSFFGKTEMGKALRLIASNLKFKISNLRLKDAIEEVIAVEEQKLYDRLKPYEYLRGKKAVLYTGGVKSWSFISALMDLGIEIVAVGTKKSTFEDEEKMRELLGPDAPLVEDVAPKNLLRLIRERNADMLIAGGRNQYLAVKEGIPFVDVNQERHHAYAGYDGLVNLAEQISNSLLFYKGMEDGKWKMEEKCAPKPAPAPDLHINPLKHSPAIGAAMAFQGIHMAVPVIHGAQGCNFLGKVLLTRHFREPISMVSSKLFAEDVIMGSEEALAKTVEGLAEKNSPDLIALVSTGLPEVKGDDISSAARELSSKYPDTCITSVQTPDYAGGLEQGYAKAVIALLALANTSDHTDRSLVNILAGPHLTPADVTELKEVVGSFGLKAAVLPDLSALDGSRQGISPLSEGGTKVSDIRTMGSACFTFVVGACMEESAELLKKRTGVEYAVLESIAGLADTDSFMKMLSVISGRQMTERTLRQRRILVDTLRDAHFHTAGKLVCIALDESHAVQTSRWVAETGASIKLAVLPHKTSASGSIMADRIIMGGLSEINKGPDLIIANSHAALTASRLGAAHYEMGFPVFGIMGYCQRVTIGYRGTTFMVNDIANLLAKEVHR